MKSLDVGQMTTETPPDQFTFSFELNFGYCPLRNIVQLPELLQFPPSVTLALNGAKTHLRRWALVYLFLNHPPRSLWETQVLLEGPPSLCWVALATHTQLGHSELSLAPDCVATASCIYSVLQSNLCWGDLRLSFWTCLRRPIPPRHAFSPQVFWNSSSDFYCVSHLLCSALQRERWFNRTQCLPPLRCSQSGTEKPEANAQRWSLRSMEGLHHQEVTRGWVTGTD